VRYLAEVGAAHNHADNHGATPSVVAAQEGHLDVVQFLAEISAARY